MVGSELCILIFLGNSADEGRCEVAVTAALSQIHEQHRSEGGVVHEDKAAWKQRGTESCFHHLSSDKLFVET